MSPRHQAAANVPLDILAGLDLIYTLLSLYAPDSWERRQVFDFLADLRTKELSPHHVLCPQCDKEPLVCPKCDDLTAQCDCDPHLVINGRHYR